VTVFALRWIEGQGAAIGGRPQAIGLGPGGVMVGKPEDFSRGDHSDLTF